MPKDLFYNTGIATYIWLINNQKPVARRGKVQLINAIGRGILHAAAAQSGQEAGRNQRGPGRSILAIYEAFEESKVSKIFDTTDFGYTKVCVERPLRLRYDLKPEQRASAAPG